MEIPNGGNLTSVSQSTSNNSQTTLSPENVQLYVSVNQCSLIIRNIIGRHPQHDTVYTKALEALEALKPHCFASEEDRKAEVVFQRGLDAYLNVTQRAQQVLSEHLNVRSGIATDIPETVLSIESSKKILRKAGKSSEEIDKLSEDELLKAAEEILITNPTLALSIDFVLLEK